MNSNKLDRQGNIEVYYKEFYSEMMGHNSKGFLSILWKYPHRLMEKPFKNNSKKRILELGAGEGEHLQFVKQNFNEYLLTDIDKKRLDKIIVEDPQRVSTKKVDASHLPFGDNTFDRVVATCLIAHLSDPEKAMSEWRRVLKPGGNLSIYVPCEPGFALRLFRKLFTAPKAKKLGFEGFNLYIARDHVNDAFRILNLLVEIFREDSVKLVFRPFYFRTWYLNLFCIAQVTKAPH